MDNNVKTDINNLQYQAKVCAAQGLLASNQYAKIFDRTRIYCLAINILTTSGLILTAGLSSAIPITLGIVSLSLLIYNIVAIRNRYLTHQIANRWDPIFRHILRGDYEAAYKDMDSQLGDPLYDLESFQLKCETLLKQLPIPHPRVSSTDTALFQNLYMDVTALNAIQLVSKYGLVDLEDSKKRINESSKGLRCVDEKANRLTELCTVKTIGHFEANTVANMAEFLFNDTIRTLAEDVGPTLKEPKHIGGGAWDHTGKPTLKFFRLLRDFGEGKIDSVKLKTILQCKNLKELTEQSLNFNKK